MKPLTSWVAAAAIIAVAHAAVVHAQDPLSNAKRLAHNAANATNAHIAAEQNPSANANATVSSAPGAAANAGAANANAKPNHEVKQQTLASNAAAPARPGAPAAQTQGSGALHLNIATADTGGPAPTVLREVYDYSRDGRRDPFVSLLTTNELRPAMSDLRLTGILYDQSGVHSVATLRDLGTNAQYRVSIGSILGRMRVSEIRTKSVVFTIDEFGSTRQDSLFFGDSTKARTR